jgi:fused signal recognition particle receptor
MAWDTIKRLFGGGKLGQEAAAQQSITAPQQQIFHSLRRSRQSLGGTLGKLFARLVGSDESTLRCQLKEDLEPLLYAADLGSLCVEELLAELNHMPAPLTREAVQQRWFSMLHQTLQSHPTELPLIGSWHDGSWQGLRVVLLVGVNGVGKTTSTAKLAHYYKDKLGKHVLLAAADTFRAAATEQLEIWAQRLGVECIHQGHGSDPAAVVFDAVKAASARGADLLLIDTGGRLHTKHNLMESLQKMRRSVEKASGKPADGTWLILDAAIGQNAIAQAREFMRQGGLTGLIVTKLDGTAKGGAVVQIRSTLELPILFVGTGEQLGDLAPFDAQAYAAGLLLEE